ncbi:tetratricopeptide repeat protein [Jejudonia soesokkakensis]|uniref:Tetratricopeptide repeat protein n=1 Tax=Jejudonia soesokkakensis TaxID=1323432 RepID=A0ABW2MVF0_9FLAO
MSFQKIFFLLLCMVASTLCFAQGNGDVNRDVDVTKVYEQVVKEGFGTTLIYKDLANAHYFKSNYADAKKWFEKLFSLEPPTDATLQFRYKQSLKALGEYSPDNKYLQKKKATATTASN